MPSIQDRVIPENCPYCGGEGYVRIWHEPTRTMVHYICGHNLVMREKTEAIRTAIEE